MPEELTTQNNNEPQSPEDENPNSPFQIDLDDDSLTDAAIGFGLGTLATLLIVSIASIFKR